MRIFETLLVAVALECDAFAVGLGVGAQFCSTRQVFRLYAVLKTLGFGRGHIAGLIFGESFVITMMGCGLGMAATFPAAQLFSQTLGAYFPIFQVEPKTLYFDLMAAGVVGICAAMIPTMRAIRIRIADGLRRIG